MARVILLTGGNAGDVKRTLQAAQQLINARVGAVLRCSHRYESEAWGFAAAERFSNQALEVDTDLSPEEVLDAVQGIERELGRNRAAEAFEKASTGVRYVSRPIDIDIAYYDDRRLDTGRLSIPHPLLAERAFALVPLCEIAGDRYDVRTGRTVAEMLGALRAAAADAPEAAGRPKAAGGPEGTEVPEKPEKPAAADAAAGREKPFHP